MTDRESRRAFFALLGAGAGAVVVAGCRTSASEDSSAGATTGAEAGASPAIDAAARHGADEDHETEVTAVEDLMREHGVIRRALVVYREAALRLRLKPANVPLEALQSTAKLLRDFGENYHEKQLEEAHIFPAVRKAKGAAAGLVDTLIAQHNRGREITDYVIALTPAALTKSSGSLAQTLEGFARMYEEHAAFEDTVIFPAWKETMSAKQLDEMGDLFEDIEHKTFGKDGFDDAVDRITAIERAMGIELAGLLPPPPPAP